MNGDVGSGRQVVPRSHGPQAGGSSSSALWTLPPCQLTVWLREHGQFWREVRAKIKEMVYCAFARKLPDYGADFSSPAAAARETISGDAELTPSQTSASVPVESTGRDSGGVAALSGVNKFSLHSGASPTTLINPYHLKS